MLALLVGAAHAASLPPLFPVGRWFYSDDPSRSAALLTQSLGATATVQNFSRSNDCALVVSVQYAPTCEPAPRARCVMKPHCHRPH